MLFERVEDRHILSVIYNYEVKTDFRRIRMKTPITPCNSLPIFDM